MRLRTAALSLVLWGFGIGRARVGGARSQNTCRQNHQKNCFFHFIHRWNHKSRRILSAIIALNPKIRPNVPCRSKNAHFLNFET
jgi:hypothetical protein